MNTLEYLCKNYLSLKKYLNNLNPEELEYKYTEQNKLKQNFFYVNSSLYFIPKDIFNKLIKFYPLGLEILKYKIEKHNLLEKDKNMTDILNRCDALYKKELDCSDKNERYKKGGCLECTQKNFRISNNDTYDCLKKLCTYTMYYGPIYINEIYSFLKESKIIENNFLELNRPINVMSLGCGFAPDDIALHKYINTYLVGKNVHFNYEGYDIEPLWNFITQTDAKPITYNVLDGINLQDINILFINKLFSTLKNLGLHNDFLKILRNALEQLPSGSFVVFNDVNHYERGRDDFDKFMNSNNLKCINKYYFDGYSGDYTYITMDSNICYIIDNPSIKAKELNQTIIFLYQKV